MSWVKSEDQKNHIPPEQLMCGRCQNNFQVVPYGYCVKCRREMKKRRHNDNKEWPRCKECGQKVRPSKPLSPEAQTSLERGLADAKAGRVTEMDFSDKV